MQILITGVAGSGKTTISEELNRIDKEAIDIERVDGLFSMIERATGKIAGKFDVHDIEMQKKHNWVCNIDKLKETIEANSDKNVYYCGTGGNILDTLPLFDKVFLLTASDEVLRERLTNRKNNYFAQTPEIQDWVCEYRKPFEKACKEAKVEIIDTNKELSDVVNEIVEKSK